MIVKTFKMTCIVEYSHAHKRIAREACVRSACLCMFRNRITSRPHVASGQSGQANKALLAPTTPAHWCAARDRSHYRGHGDGDHTSCLAFPVKCLQAPGSGILRLAPTFPGLGLGQKP